SGSGRKAIAEIDDLAHRVGDGFDLSSFRADWTGDERTLLVLTPLQYALQWEPGYIAWEQVPGVMPVWETCAAILRGRGYGVTTAMVNAQDYGVPQSRKRAVLLARKDGVEPRLQPLVNEPVTMFE